MLRIEERYYKYNQVLLKILGLWPYQQSCFARIQRTLLTAILLIFILAQLFALMTTQYDVNLLLDILSFVFPTLFASIKYWLFIIQIDSIKQLLTQIRNDWKLLRNQSEIDIIEKYACNARSFIVNLTVFIYSGSLFITIIQFLPLILDVVLPLNESRSCQLFIIAEYFVNQDKYFYILSLHEILVLFLGITIVCSTGGILNVYIFHICALFDIARFHMENAIVKSTSAISSPKKENFVYQKMVHAVVIHQRAIECVIFFTSNFALLFFVLIVVGVSSLSFNIFHFVQIVTLSKDIDRGVLAILMIAIHLFYMFITNSCGQKVTDHGRKFFRTTCDVPWYKTSLPIQKLLLFIIQRGTINVTITLGNIFVASLEGFASLVNMAVSYFMVIYSTQ